ncbi:MAG: bifunctional adenosylcobinamide kinase/adenosylcobinamide-phosphate guanylyltransferase [Leptolyngbya sp.]|nr:bifunctional adenosylcobinamide kinase/adenosylcobinamide-phosphate guanylyltransferase [Candidatus Melainabacteria bacterium]
MSNTADSALKNLTLITGGARSGKSLLAEQLALAGQRPVVYLATMEELKDDAESVIRINLHRSRRPSNWHTIEAPNNLSEVITSLENKQQTCIIDCLSLLVSNILLKADALGEGLLPARDKVACEVESVLEAINTKPEITFLTVTNEVGSGIVPENALARSYRDLLGESNQTFARQAATVYFTCVGLNIKLK